MIILNVIVKGMQAGASPKGGGGGGGCGGCDTPPPPTCQDIVGKIALPSEKREKGEGKKERGEKERGKKERERERKEKKKRKRKERKGGGELNLDKDKQSRTVQQIVFI